MTDEPKPPLYQKGDARFKPQPCPRCGRQANGHFWVYREPPPPPPAPDRRLFVDEVFIHEWDIEDCHMRPPK